MNAVDTNVLVYACDKAAGRHQKKALELLHEMTDCVLLWQVACEFVAASRKLQADDFQPADAWQRLASFMKLMPLALPTGNVLNQAKAFHLDRQVSFWDAMIYAACRETGVQRIYSEDLPGSALPDLEVINPFVGLR